MRRIYMDANATTPLLLEVFEAMRPFWMEHYGNASSIHQQGQQARHQRRRPGEIRRRPEIGEDQAPPEPLADRGDGEGRAREHGDDAAVLAPRRRGFP